MNEYYTPTQLQPRPTYEEYGIEVIPPTRLDSWTRVPNGPLYRQPPTSNHVQLWLFGLALILVGGGGVVVGIAIGNASVPRQPPVIVPPAVNQRCLFFCDGR